MPSAEKLAKLIDNAKVLEPGYRLSVSVRGNEESFLDIGTNTREKITIAKSRQR